MSSLHRAVYALLEHDSSVTVCVEKRQYARGNLPYRAVAALVHLESVALLASATGRTAQSLAAAVLQAQGWGTYSQCRAAVALAVDWERGILIENPRAMGILLPLPPDERAQMQKMLNDL